MPRKRDIMKELKKQWRAQGRCVKCGKPKADHSVCCVQCLAADRLRENKRKARLRAAGLCLRCGRNPIDNGGASCAPCRAKIFLPAAREKNREQAQKLRADVIGAYGGVCACCGEDELRFLEVDHIFNDGNTHRELNGIHAGVRGTYRWLRNHGYPPGFQVLCKNCNWGKYVNGGICPHQTKGLLANAG